MGLFWGATCVSSQVIKHKLCRCSGRKHQHNNNDQGTVLSLDDVKCHVSNFHWPASARSSTSPSLVTRGRPGSFCSKTAVEKVSERFPGWRLKSGGATRPAGGHETTISNKRDCKVISFWRSLQVVEVFEGRWTYLSENSSCDAHLSVWRFIHCHFIDWATG